MAIATYKDLCIDATDVRRLGEFWARTLDLRLEPLDDGDARLTGPTPQHTIWLNAVPEPVTVKQRVHLDVYARSVDDVLALGATPQDLETYDWKVVRDPEGGELCVFERPELPDSRLMEIVVDCADDEQGALAAWWADVLDGVRRDEDDGRYSWVEGIAGAPFKYLVFVPVPEPKTVKNRVHVDLRADSVEALAKAGAGVLRERDDEIGWTVMTDPAGNEFCVFTPTE